MINYEAGRAFALGSLSQSQLHNDVEWREWIDGLITNLKKPIMPPNPVPVAKQVIIYTDGSCLGNPGNGGYSAILTLGEYRREISGGEPKTTNNRMELMGVISALEALKKPAVVVVHTDSTYVKTNYPRLTKWATNGWVTSTKEPVANTDLWQRLQKAVEEHCVTITFEKVKGHSGHPENERCDKLARQAAMSLKGEANE